MFETLKLSLNARWMHYELPRVTILNQDSKFTNIFWQYFFIKIGTKLTFSTNFYPLIDGEIKHVNGVLNQYLKNFVSAD